jgi:hypothetical protein
MIEKISDNFSTEVNNWLSLLSHSFDFTLIENFILSYELRKDYNYINLIELNWIMFSTKFLFLYCYNWSQVKTLLKFFETSDSEPKFKY